MTTLARPALQLSLRSLSLPVGACTDGDDGAPAPTAEFSRKDDAHLHRTAFAATGGDAFYLRLAGALYAGEDSAGCPSVSTTGAVTTVTGGCTLDSGQRAEGTLTLTNVESFLGPSAYDPSQPSRYEARGWRIDQGDGPEASDGVVTLTPTANGVEMVAKLDTTLWGIRTSFVGTYVCPEGGLCKIAAGSRLDVDGVGSAELSGEFDFDVVPGGTVTVAGVEKLTVVIDGSTERCFQVAIDGGPVRAACIAQ